MQLPSATLQRHQEETFGKVQHGVGARVMNQHHILFQHAALPLHLHEFIDHIMLEIMPHDARYARCIY